MYGKTTDENGKPLGNGFLPVLTGEKVVGNELLSLDFADDKTNEGQKLFNRAELKFKQSNGAIFTYNFFDSTEDWAIKNTNMVAVHVFTKIVSKEEYESILSNCSNFQEFIQRIKDQIVPKAVGKKFTLKIVYNVNKKTGKAYVTFPNFPNFIELDGTTPSTLTTNPKYDIYERPKETNMASQEPTMNASDGKDDLPF